MSILALAFLSHNCLGSSYVYIWYESTGSVLHYNIINSNSQMNRKHLEISLRCGKRKLAIKSAMLFSIGLVSTFITGGSLVLF
jgi:hypothetical protein